MTRAKICGISTPETIDAALAGGASHIGFNFYPPSPRHLSLDAAHGLAVQVSGRAGKVGVFVDPSDEELAGAIAAARLDAVQLHKVTAARRAAVRAQFGLPIWAVMPVKGAGDLAARHQIDPGTADFVLYDAATPDGAPLPGGMGVRIDWTLFDGLSHPLPWGLAGGLNPGNVGEAIALTGAPLVDVSSGVESAPGIKDVDKIRAFLQATSLS